jgi:hypothetical protein
MRGPVRPLFQTLFQIARDFGALIGSAMRSRAQLVAEHLFLRKRLPEGYRVVATRILGGLQHEYRFEVAA